MISPQQPVMTPSQPQHQTYPTRPPQMNQAPPGSFAARSAQAHSAAGMPSHVYGSGVPYGGTPASYGGGTPASYGGGQSVVSSLGGSPQQGSYAQRSAYGAPQPNPQAFAGQQQPYTTHQVPQQMPRSMPSPYGSVPGNPPQVPPYVGVKQHPPGMPTPQDQAMQQRMLTEATRKVQEHAYYMRQAMEQNNIPVTLDRAAHMVGELGELPHGQQAASISPSASNPSAASSSSGPSNSGLSSKLTPKNYYELYMRALEDMPTFEDFLLNLAQPAEVPAGQIQIVASPAPVLQRKSPFTLRELYDCVQYCPRVLPRIYLQIAAGSALIRSGEVGAKWVLNDLIQAVRCEQNPIRGLFLRHYLLTALRDKLPGKPVLNDVSSDTQVSAGEENTEAVTSVKTLEIDRIDESDPGTVKDSYEFVLENFMEMNKLWVRIQHLPGEGSDKDVRKRRERERNDLRILVGTNLVRLSQLENVTSKIYGEVILNQILDHIVTCGDPLSQAYLMDCLVQTFPDEYHIETLPILLSVCPRLRDKVNIRTILQGLMDRLANYLGDEELLDESDTNQVKKELARDSFGMFEECVQNVYNARGPKLTAREVIRLQTALLTFSVRCYPENTEQVARCLGSCVAALRQANASYEMAEGTVIDMPQDKILVKALDEVSVAELEKLLSIPLEKLALKCLRLEHYGELISFLPWANRRQVAIALLEAVDNMGTTPESVSELEQLFQVIAPLVRDETTQTPIGAQNHYQMDMTRAFNLMANLGVSASQPVHVVHGASVGPEHLKQVQAENALVCKLLHLIGDPNTDHVYEQLCVARKHLEGGESYRQSETLVSVVFASLKLTRRIFAAEYGLDEAKNDDGTEGNKNESKEGASSRDKGSSEANSVDSVAEEDTSGDGKIVVQEEGSEQVISDDQGEGSVDRDYTSSSKAGAAGRNQSDTPEDLPSASADVARKIR
jgi:vacuolar protein sorting-associated protein 35